MLVILLKHFWLIAIIVTFANILFFRQNANKHIAENPQLKEGYDALIKGMLFWLSLPWVVMGIGCTVGGVPSVFYYFRPKDGNLFVLAWFATIFAIWAIGFVWIFFKGGADALAKYSGMIVMRTGFQKKEIKNPAMIKLLWILMLAGGIAGVSMMWFADIPIPQF